MYEVIEIPYKDLPVLKIRPVEDPSAKPRVLHRNLLQPNRQIKDGVVDSVESIQTHPPTDLNVKEARSCSAEDSTGDTDESALKGPTTRSIVKGGMRTLVNSVQVVTGVRSPMEIIRGYLRRW